MLKITDVALATVSTGTRGSRRKNRSRSAVARITTTPSRIRRTRSISFSSEVSSSLGAWAEVPREMIRRSVPTCCAS